MPQPKRTILIVDDEPRQRELLSGFVSSLGFQVADAATGEAALELLDAQSVCMVLLDVRLPGISGLEVLEQIRHRNPAYAGPAADGLCRPAPSSGGHERRR